MKKIIISIFCLFFSLNNCLSVFALENNADWKTKVIIQENDTFFKTKLSKNYIGKIYSIENTNDKPVVIKQVELVNNREVKTVLKKSKIIMTPGSCILSVVGGLLALPTFGISLALLVPASAELAVKNSKIQKEAQSAITTKPLGDVVLESGKSYEVKAIFEKTTAVNKTPIIKVRCFNPELNEETILQLGDLEEENNELED